MIPFTHNSSSTPSRRATLFWRAAGTFVAAAGMTLVASCSSDRTTSPELRPTGPSADAAASAGKVLILERSVEGGASSTEAMDAAALGFTPVLASDAMWSSLTAADFASYRALVIGDPSCTVGTADITAAENNASTWGPVVNGNVFINGTDPVFHQGSQPGAALMTQNGIKFATAVSGKTGAYISLSCRYTSTFTFTPVKVLSGLSTLGGFTSAVAGSCYNNAHIVATSPALTGLTDANLSNWSCSVHEDFGTWPSDFDVLAIAKNLGSAFHASDGTVGTPYILARGQSLVIISDIQLAPATQTVGTGSSATVTATVKSGGSPIVGTTVTFKVVDGPNAGTTGTAVTNASGVATFSYTSGVTGTDGLRASFVDASSATQTSNRVEVVWSKATTNNPPFITGLHQYPSALPLSVGTKTCGPSSGRYTACIQFAANDPDFEGTFQAWVDWGDGTATIGPYNIPKNQFSIVSGHNYAAAGTYTVTVKTQDMLGATDLKVLSWTVAP